MRVGGTSGTDEVAVDISAWQAGQTHLLVGRWDNDNGLSGANTICLSIDDVHAFGTQLFPPTQLSPFNYVGSDRDSLHPANALIEGLTIYRRPLYDGAAGIDVGQGDELNRIYNAGAGTDPTFITGSWDVTFALPTNSQTGDFGSGTGNACGHPHSSNLLPGNANAGGFMLAGTPATDGWNNEGAPTSVLALAATEKVYPGGYKATSNAANQGIYQDITVAPGDDWVVRAVAHSDGTCRGSFFTIRPISPRLAP